MNAETCNVLVSAQYRSSNDPSQAREETVFTTHASRRRTFFILVTLIETMECLGISPLVILRRMVLTKFQHRNSYVVFLQGNCVERSDSHWNFQLETLS